MGKAEGIVTPFTTTVRVYYEDTDTARIVYYANYLKYFERGRTEWLRSLGYSQNRLAEEHGLAFAVRSVRVDYNAPARLDDLLLISTAVKKVSAARIFLEQSALRGQQCLVSAEVQVVCVNMEKMQAVAIPESLTDLLKEPF